MTPQQLKNSILQMAMKGKLVEQRPEEGTGEELYRQIQKEKQKLIKEGKIKKGKPLPEIKEDEIPFEIPESWKWVRIGSISSVITGGTPSKSQTDYYGGKFPFYKPADITNSKYISSASEHLTDLGKANARLIPKGSIAVNCIGSIGKSAITPMDSTTNQQINSACYYPYPDYLYWTFQSATFKSQLLSKASMTTLPIVNKSKMEECIVSLPPIAEQKRIVAKIEEIMPYIDRYAVAYDHLQSYNTRFPDDLKKSILQMAMQGKLVEQRPEEGTGEELYQQIQKEKQKLIKEGKIKKEKPLPEITEDEVPFEIPESWKWVRTGEIGSWGSGATPSRSHPEYYGGNIPWLKTGDLNDGYIESVPESITKEGYEHSSVRLNPIGSVLIAMYGATIGKLGILKIKATTNQACCACIPFDNVEDRYIFYYLLSHRKQFIEQGAGGAQPNISKEKILETVFPLPPFAEQKRIVAKLDELLYELERINMKKN